MKLVSRVTIHAPAEVVWPYVSDPVIVSIWNEKIVAVSRAVEGPVSPDEEYRLTYRMSRDVDAEATVTACEAPRRLEIRNTMRSGGREGFVTEAYELRDAGPGTELVQSLDLSESGLPRVVQWTAWALFRWGKPVNTPHLEILRDLVEADEADSAPRAAA